MFKFSFELNERVLCVLLGIAVIAGLLHWNIVEFEQVESLLFGMAGVLAGRHLPGNTRAAGPAV